jgi:hypothetical protein
MSFNFDILNQTPEVVEAIPQEADTIPSYAMFPNIETVKSGLAVYDKQIDELITQASAVEVIDPETNKAATAYGAKISKLNKGIEEIRKQFVREPNDYVGSINSLAKSYQDRLKAAEYGVKRKIQAYQAKVELERRKQEEMARRAAAEAQARLDAEAKAAHVEPVKIEAPVIPKKETVTRTAEGSSNVSKHWNFEIVNADEVPRQYLVIDDKAINLAIKAGVREIPGVRIFQDTRISFR